MRRVVLDASAFLDWFAPSGPGRSLRAEYESGQLRVHVPTLFPLHVLEATAQSGQSDADRLARLAEELNRIGFERRDPPASELASWLARGLGAAHAPYAALAASLGVPLVTTDRDLQRSAESVAQRP